MRITTEIPMNELKVTRVTETTPSEVSIPNQVNVQDTGPAANSNPVTNVTDLNRQRETDLRSCLLSREVLAEGEAFDSQSGEIIRFSDARDTPSNKSGWCIPYFNGQGVLTAAAYGSWHHEEEKTTWLFDGYDDLTEEERSVILEEYSATRDAKLKADKVKKIECRQKLAGWLETGTLITEESFEHPYLVRKGIKVFEDIYLIGDELVIPLFNENGELITAQRVKPNGSKRFIKGCGKKGSFHLMSGNNDVVFVAEGYATAASLREATGYTTVMGIDAGNLLPTIIGLTRMPQFKRSGFIICGDNDQYGENNVGYEKATEAANAIGANSVFPSFQDESTKPTDFNDLHLLEGIDEVVRQLDGNIQYALLGLPEEFDIDELGVHEYIFNPKTKEKVRTWICSHLLGVAATRDRDSENWGLYLQVKDDDDVIHYKAMSREVINDPKGFLDILSNFGFRYDVKFKANVSTYLSKLKPITRAVSTSKIGWKDDSFILPGKMIGNSNEQVVLQTRALVKKGYECRGELEEWQRDLSLNCVGNPKMIFAVALAFASPLIPMVGAESGGFHLRCGSSRGKTTILRLAKSVWGGVESLPRWRATDNGIESIAALHNHTLLCLDEFGQLDPKHAGDAIYLLGNGEGKQRSGRHGEATENQTWELFYLSTGEISLRDTMMKVGQNSMAGQEVRFIDLPAESDKGMGAFDDIHGYETPAHFANSINLSANKYHGTAAPAYLEFLTSDYEGHAATASQYIDEFVELCEVTESDAQVQRVAKKLGVVYAGGQLATDFGITGWPEDIVKQACKESFDIWLEERGGDGSHEERHIFEDIQSRLQSESHRHFVNNASVAGSEWPVGAGNQTIWGHKFNNKFHVFPKNFKDDLCAGHDSKRVCELLDKMELIEKAGDGSMSKSVRINGKTSKVYVIKESILNEGSEEETDEPVVEEEEQAEGVKSKW